MNERVKIEEQELIDLYNVGYGLNKYSPEMAELIDHINIASQKMKALKAGIDQSKGEFTIERKDLPFWLKRDRFKENVRDLDAIKNRGIEPEKD
jgi:hypothetical protein